MTETLDAAPSAHDGFRVRVADFEGPFDLLLQLIGKHQLEVTELALHQVTDDFIAYIRTQEGRWSLDEATEFLVVAATLLDLKAARLLPSGEVEDEEDLAILEARDLLFARLLQSTRQCLKDRPATRRSPRPDPATQTSQACRNTASTTPDPCSNALPLAKPQLVLHSAR